MSAANASDGCYVFKTGLGELWSNGAPESRKGEGFDAGAVVREAAPIIGGGGGGRADLAQAGGKDASRLEEALREAGRLALESLKRIETG